MHIIKKILKIFLVFVAILIGIIGLFFGKILFDLWSNGALFLDSKDVIYENWHVRLPEGGKKYTTQIVGQIFMEMGKGTLYTSMIMKKL